MPQNLAKFGLLVEEHQKAIRAFVAARIDDPFEAQDMAQEVFLVAYRKLDEFDSTRPVRPWLCGIANNLVRNHWQKRRAATLDEADGDVFGLLAAEVERMNTAWHDSSILDSLELCLERLNESARELLRLRYEDGLGISEIRNSVGGQHSAITMRLHRLREQLRDCIERRMGEVNHG